MKIIKNKTGWKKGKMGVTIQIFQQKHKRNTKALTIHGMDVEEIYNQIKFWFLLLEEKPKKVKITFEE